MAKKKNRNLIIAAAVVVITAALIFAYSSSESTERTVTIEGIIYLGEQIGRDYCPEGVYIQFQSEEGTKQFQLRNSDGSSPGNDFLLKYLGKAVKMTAKHDPNRIYCEALICQCDEYIVVQEVQLIG